MPRRIWTWLSMDGRSGVIGAVAAIAGVIIAVLQFAAPLIQGDPDPDIVATEGAAVSIGSGPAIAVNDNATFIVGYTIEQHERALDRRLGELRADLERAHAAEQDLLRRQISEVERQKSDLETSFGEREAELRRLRNELEALAVNVPQDRLEAAQAALYRGETDLADQLFAEIEEAESEAIQRAAEAAFHRGEIAEEEVRWADAAAHYARAATLSPDYSKLFRACTFAWRSGDYREAFRYGRLLLDVAKAEFGDGSTQHAKALNQHALTLRAMGRYKEAEPLYRQAIEIGKATIGEAHPDYAKRLNNLANLLSAMGRHEEAEPLYRRAIEIDKATIGEAHPDYAIHLNNLALLLRAMGRHEEAEPLYRQAIEIDKATIGEAHPDYATRLNNLASLLRAMGRHEEAEPLYRQAIEIGKATIGEAHPDYAVRLNNLAVLLEGLGRMGEVPGLYRDAVRISRAALGDAHPDTRKRAWNYAGHLRKHAPDDPDLADLIATFGDDIGR